eukprot:2343102-Rhodomonas_salina.1
MRGFEVVHLGRGRRCVRCFVSVRCKEVFVGCAVRTIWFQPTQKEQTLTRVCSTSTDFDWSQTDACGRSLLGCAASWGDLPTVQLLVELGADLESVDGRVPDRLGRCVLHHASRASSNHVSLHPATALLL